jgi:hypothetical protein
MYAGIALSGTVDEAYSVPPPLSGSR